MSESACVKDTGPAGAQELVRNGDNATSRGHDPGLASGVRFRNSFGTHRDVLNALEAEIIFKLAVILAGAIVALCVLGTLLSPGTYSVPN